MKNVIPQIGVQIALNRAWIIQANPDSIKQKAFIRYVGQEWVLVDPAEGRGMLVFLNDNPADTDTHLQISAITPTGTACYADPVQV